MASAVFLLDSHALLRSHVPRSRLGIVASRARVREVRRGGTIFRVGDHAGSVFLLHGGRIKIHRGEEVEGREVLVAIHRPGEILGDDALCQPWRQSRASALESCLLTEIHVMELRALFLEYPALLLAWALGVREHLMSVEERLAGFAYETLRERIWTALCHFGARFGVDVGDGRRVLDLRLTLEDLAGWVGSHRVSVHHELRHLDVRRGDGKLTVLGASIGGRP